MSNGNNFTRQYSTIKGLSDRRRLPLLGTIRLGKVVKNKSGNTKKCTHDPKEYCDFCSHPTDCDYFVCPQEVKEFYGPEPKELDVMFPIDYLPAIFPQAYKLYAFSGLRCKGDGEKASRWDEKKGWVEQACPCQELKSKENPRGQCSPRGELFMILWKINMGGVYRVTSGSFNSLVDVQSGLEYHQALIGRFARVPLILKRTQREITYTDDKGKQHKSIHYPLSITSRLSVEEVSRLKADTQRILPEIETGKIALPAPTDDNPLRDAGAVIVADEEKESSYSGNGEGIKAGGNEAQDVQADRKTGGQVPRPLNVSPDIVNAVTDKQRKKMFALARNLNISHETLKGYIKKQYDKDSTKDLTELQMCALLDNLEEANNGLCDARFKNGELYFDYPPAQD